MFIPPMLARPLNEKFVFQPNLYSAEEKIDGIRIICEISDGASNLFADKQITPWSRYGIIHPLPTHILEDLCKFPNCILDGEIYVPGKRSYGATEIINQPDLIFCVFDILEIKGVSGIYSYTYDVRRLWLEDHQSLMENSVHLIASTRVNTWEEVTALRDAVWARDGEGLILKQRKAPYQPGKRSKDFIKIKDLKSSVLTVIGFQPSRGTINYRGPYAMTILKDDEGNITTVKTRNDAECRKLEQMAQTIMTGLPHPAIGRRLRIEYQERTPDKNYRHPRWDRWEDE